MRLQVFGGCSSEFENYCTWSVVGVCWLGWSFHWARRGAFGGFCENFAHGPGRAAVFETISSAAARKPPEDKLFCCLWDKLSCVGRLIPVFESLSKGLDQLERSTKQLTMLAKLFASHFSEHNSNVKAIYWMMLIAWTQFSPLLSASICALAQSAKVFRRPWEMWRDTSVSFSALRMLKPLCQGMFSPIATYSFFSHSLLVDSPIPASGFRFLQTTSDESLVVVATFWCCLLSACAWWKQHGDLSGELNAKVWNEKYSVLSFHWEWRQTT